MKRDRAKSSARALPEHIAFIMDGNGRWAKARKLDRRRGHEQGARVLREVVRHCRKLGIPEITFYALSTENFSNRPRLEIRYLMSLLRDYLIGERRELKSQNIQFRAIGRVEELPDSVLKEIRRNESETLEHDGMVLRLALNYGSRTEILDAIRRMKSEIEVGQLSLADLDLISDQTFRQYLYDPDMRDPDLLVRTAGELRVSNFLLWQISYTELWVTDEKWPDFTPELLDKAIDSYAQRERRFGRVPANLRDPRD